MEEKEFKNFCVRAGGQEGKTCRYALRMDTYGCGCSHDCKYCYAKSLLSFRKLWNPQNPKAANLRKIEEAIKRLAPNSLVRLGGMTDCFQSCEETRHVTYETIKLLNRHRIFYLIVTKSDLIASDEYMQILDRGLAHIQISVTSTDDAISRQIEQAPVSSRRIAAIEKLAANDFDVQVRLSPFVREWIDPEKINTIRCDKILVEFLRVNHWIRKWLDIDFSGYTHYENGYNHLPLETKIEMMREITGFRDVSVCEDCIEHFHYWQRQVNPNYYDCCNLRL